MQTPSVGKTQPAPSEQVPPGGRAFERVKQDRAARGLGAPPQAGTLVVEDGSPSKKRRPAVKPTTKTAKRR